MPQLGITENGHLYEVDVHDSDKMGRVPVYVEEFTPMIDSPSTIHWLTRQAEAKKLAALQAEQNKRAKTLGALKAKKEFDEQMYLDTLHRQSVPLSGPEKMIAEGIASMKTSRMVDFNREQIVDVTNDFGAHPSYPDHHASGDRTFGTHNNQEMGVSQADFNWQRPFDKYVVGNPLTPDGTVGPVTDYERFVNENAEGDARGSVPSNMDANGNAQYTSPCPSNSHPMSGMFGQTENIFDVGPPPDMPADPNAPPPSGDTSAIDQAYLDSLTSAGPSSIDTAAPPPDISASDAAILDAATPTPSTPSFWTGLESSLLTAAPSLVQQGEASLLKSLQPGAPGAARPSTTVAPRSVVPSAPMSSTTKMVALVALVGGALLLANQKGAFRKRALA